MLTVLICSNNNDEVVFFNWIKKYGSSYDDKYVYYNNFRFTTKNKESFDAILVINQNYKTIKVAVKSENVFVFMQEPGIKPYHNFMYKCLNQYNTVVSPIKSGKNTIWSHGYLGWYINKSRKDLEIMEVPEKTKKISCIASSKVEFKGHRKRLKFARQLTTHNFEIDYFGFDKFPMLPLIQKHEGLFPYKYAITIENSSIPHYFTEKIMDCFVSYTIPFYYGCTNIDNYFPSRSYILIDINDPIKAFNTIKETLENKNDYEERLPALIEARNLVLNKYQPLAGFSIIAQNLEKSNEKINIILQANNYNFFQKVKIKINKIFYTLLYKK